MNVDTNIEELAARISEAAKPYWAGGLVDVTIRSPEDLLKLPPDRQPIVLLILLLLNPRPNLAEEDIKKTIAHIAERCDVTLKDQNTIFKAFDYASGNHGTRVKHLRRQFTKAC